MTTPEVIYDIDHIADNRLSEEDSWRASRFLGDIAMARILAEGEDGRQVCYQIEDAHEALVGISEQPDLRGPVLVEMGIASGDFIKDRTLVEQHGYALPPREEGQFMALNVRHQQTYESLLRVALPTEDATVALLRYGHVMSSAYPRHGLVRTLDRYTPRDLMLNPRRVQAAASLIRCITEQQIIAGDPQELSSEEKEKFINKYFPYQELALTGGGGKTVAMRAYRP